MTEPAEVEGRCLCGAVRFTTAAPREITACHCGMCRRWGGGLPMAAFDGEVSLSQSDALRWWKSSPWGERGFCGECGASLFWRALGAKKWEVSAGALESTDGARIDAHIYIDDKPGFYDFSDDARRMTGAEFTASILPAIVARFGVDLQDAIEQCRMQNGAAFAAEVERLLAEQKS